MGRKSQNRKMDLSSKRFLIIILGMICTMTAPIYCGIETSNVLICIGTLVVSYMGVRAVQSMTQKEGE